MALRQALTGLALIVLIAVPAAARQTAGTASGSIVGSVRDETGAVLRGVSVAVRSDALMTAHIVVTDSNGRFHAHALPPGDYTLSFTLDGFRRLVHGPIGVRLGFTATVNVELGIEGTQEGMTVAARGDVLDRHATGITETFDRARLASLPSSRSLFAVLATTPTVHVASLEVGGSAGTATGPYGAYGGRGANRPVIEGVLVTAIFGTGFTLDYGSFEEVSVLTAGHGAEWATHGVHVQIVSKSGGNQYRGTLYADYEHRRWQAFNVDDEQIHRGASGGGGLSPRETNRVWHYHDLNADLGGFISRDRLWWYASSRSQELQTRLVNFPVGPRRTGLINYTGKATYRPAAAHTLVGFAQAGRNRQPNGLDPFGPAGGSLSAASALNESESSTADQRSLGWVWKTEWSAALRNTLLIELRAAQFGSNQGWTPRSALPRFEDVETLAVTGGNRDWGRTLRRNQGFATMSYFQDGRLGQHHLKLGAELLRWVETESWRTGYPGDRLHVLRNGAPVEVYLFHTPTLSASGLWTYSFYATDSWRINNRLTINLGARFDRYRVFLPAQEHPAGGTVERRFEPVDTLIAWNVAVPRFGAVYDLDGTGRTLAKVSLGRYRLAPGTFVGFNANPNAPTWWTRYQWTDSNGNGVWDPGEEGAELGRRGGAAAESIGPGLKLPVIDEGAGWIERELPGALGLRIGAVWRREHQQFARQNVLQPFDAFTIPVPVRDPGPDGVPGTMDDGPILHLYDLRPGITGSPVHVFANVPGSSRYLTWEVGATRRAVGAWSLGAGFAHTWAREHAAGYAAQPVRNNGYALTPNDLINTAEGGRHILTTWTGRAYGSWDGPWSLRLTPLVRHQSGQPFGRTFLARLSRYGLVRVLAEPVGTRRMDHITAFDVRIEKRMTLAGHRRVTAFLDVFNIFNANAEQNVVWSSGETFLRPLSILPPRVARIGGRLDW